MSAKAKSKLTPEQQKATMTRVLQKIQPSRPKVIKKARPTMTGEIENGISISEIGRAHV